MGREPFPRPGQRLEDIPARHDEHAPPRVVLPISFFGGVMYGPGYPSRWAGMRAMARLRVDEDTIVITPIAHWKALRAPTVRIPLGSIETATNWFGLRFGVPGDPHLDGTRVQPFFWNWAVLRPLIDLLKSRGIAVERRRGSRQFARFYRETAVGHRPGWIFRDRGRLAFLELFILAGIALGGLYLVDGAEHIALVLAAVFVALNVAWSFAGHRFRQRATRKH